MYKIYFFLPDLDGGGAQRTVINILKYIDKKKFEPTLVLLKYNENQLFAEIIPSDIPIINIGERGRDSIFKIVKILKNDKPDIVFATLPHIIAVVSIAHKLSGSSSKLIVRETNHRNKNEMSWWFYRILKWAFNYSSNVIALSEGVSSDLIKLYDLDQAKLVTIYNPVDLDMINSSLSSKFDSRSYKDNDEVVRLVACGRLVPQKNFPLLFNALALVNQWNTKWNLTLLGDGPDKKMLVDLAERLEIKNKINFKGFVNDPYMDMSKADLFVLSSSWEGFGHVIVEAMASGTPVISTDCPHGPKEILGNNQFGWLVENENVKHLSEKLLHLFENRNEIIDMSKKAKGRAEDFEAKKIVAQYERVFNNE